MSSVTLTHLGHSCFRMQYGDFRFVVDPFADGSVPGIPDIREEAEAVYCSHQHGDHNFVDGVKLTGRAAPADFVLTEIQSYHDDAQGSKRGENVIRRFDCGDVSIVHMGDVGCMPTEEQFALLRGCTVLLIPVGGFFTVDGDTAFAIAEKIAPRCVVPMHYKGESFGFGVIGTAQAFTSHYDSVTKVDRSFVVDEKSPVGCIVTL